MIIQNDRANKLIYRHNWFPFDPGFTKKRTGGIGKVYKTYLIFGDGRDLSPLGLCQVSLCLK